jgi:demethylmenaquinone methyltransferase/2-methoxy-6-polyprenyl-1,4-benzoquinol methylase
MSTRTSGAGEMGRTFGERAVEQAEKQPLIDAVFSSVAGRYDMMNDLMSGGMHRLWKDAFVARLSPPRTLARPWLGLDVAGGTGDIAFRIADASPAANMTLLDINPQMLAVGRERAVARGLADRVSFVEGNAESLPFADASFDAYTIAFGIRNVPRMDLALAEAYRVLRRGGRFLCLEFSEVSLPFFDRFYDAWSRHAIPAIGAAVTGDRQSYAYLVESIRRFPSQKAFAAMIGEAGFSRVTWRDLTGGVVAIHEGYKL